MTPTVLPPGWLTEDEPGDTVEIRTGTDGAAVVTTNDITIRGFDQDSDVAVDGDGLEHVFVTQADGMTVKGLSATESEEELGGFVVSGNKNVLKNNVATGNFAALIDDGGTEAAREQRQTASHGLRESLRVACEPLIRSKSRPPTDAPGAGGACSTPRG